MLLIELNFEHGIFLQVVYLLHTNIHFVAILPPCSWTLCVCINSLSTITCLKRTWFTAGFLCVRFRCVSSEKWILKFKLASHAAASLLHSLEADGRSKDTSVCHEWIICGDLLEAAAMMNRRFVWKPLITKLYCNSWMENHTVSWKRTILKPPPNMVSVRFSFFF